MSQVLSNQPLNSNLGMQQMQQLPASPVLGAAPLQQQQGWVDPMLNKQQAYLADDFAKRDALFHQVQLPQGVQTAQSVPHTRSQLLPVGVQGFQQGLGAQGFQQGFQQQAVPTSPLLGERSIATVDTVHTVQQPALHSGFAQSGTIALKPICIEQEGVAFRPSPITIEQPPLLVQPEAITIPQPPIVIHPEPIVIPQAPLVFQPPAVSLARQAVTYQPEAINMARPSYTIQPIIQYDMRGCADFGRADFKQHVHIKLTNEQLMRQGGGQWSSQMHTHTLGSSNLAAGTAPSSPVVGERAKFFSRDRDYNYGNAPSTGDKMKDTLGVKNLGPTSPTVETSYPRDNTANLATANPNLSNANAYPSNYNVTQQNYGGASTFSRDRDYNYGAPVSTTDRLKDSLGVRNFGPEQPVVINEPMVAPAV